MAKAMTDRKASAQASAGLPENVRVADVANLLMVTDQWIRDLSKRGYVPKPSGGRVSLVGVVQGYINWLKDEERRTSKTASQSAVAAARAREIQIRTAKDEGALIDIEDVESAFAEILGAFRSELAGVAAGSTRDLALREAINGKLNDAIARARSRFEAASALARSGRGFGVSDEAGGP